MLQLFRRQKSDLRQAIDGFLRDQPSDAPIRAVLTSDEIEERLTAFDRKDRRALRKQRRYWQAARIARWAGIFGLIVVPLDLLPIQQWLPRFIPYGLHALALTLTFLAVILLGLRRSMVQWKQARVAAERLRAEVFGAVLKAGAAAEALPQALACFTAAHLDWQMSFFEKRIAELPARIKRELKRTTPFRLVGMALSVVAACFGAVVLVKLAVDYGLPLPYLSLLRDWLTVPDVSLWQHGFKATAWSLLAFAGARLLSHEDVSNAALYPWAKDELQLLKDSQLPQAERAAAVGDLDAVVAFQAKVQKILDTEHRVWAEDGLYHGR